MAPAVSRRTIARRLPKAGTTISSAINRREVARVPQLRHLLQSRRQDPPPRILGVQAVQRGSCYKRRRRNPESRNTFRARFKPCVPVLANRFAVARHDRLREQGAAAFAASAATAATVSISVSVENPCICFGFSPSLFPDDWRSACSVFGHVANHLTISGLSRDRRSRRKIGRSMGARTSARRSRGESRFRNHLRSARSLLRRFNRRGCVANLEPDRCEVYH